MENKPGKADISAAVATGLALYRGGLIINKHAQSFTVKELLSSEPQAGQVIIITVRSDSWSGSGEYELECTLEAVVDNIPEVPGAVWLVGAIKWDAAFMGNEEPLLKRRFSLTFNYDSSEDGTFLVDKNII